MEKVRGSSPLSPTSFDNRKVEDSKGARLRVLLIGLLLLSGTVCVVFAEGKLKSAQPIAATEKKPKHRWDVVVWLQLHEELMSEKLRGQNASLADKDFIWSHVKVELQVIRGIELVPGKKKFYVAEVPTITRGSLWAARDGRVITSYKRKVDYSENRQGFIIVGVDKPRTKADKFIYAEHTTLFVDEDGNIYY